MLTFDVNALTASIYNRLFSDSAGSATRAALGNGASSVIHTKELSETRATDIVLPTPAFVALRPGPAPTSDRLIQNPTFRWYIYDDPARGYYRINALLPLIATAYDFETNPLSLTSGAIGLVEIGNPSAEIQDEKLGLFVRYLTLSVLLV